MASSSKEPEPDEILESTENGYKIFKKKQNGVDEVEFFNSEYFERLGYPGTEVSVVKIDANKEKNEMKGGYYFFPDKLTFPFRQFVYLIQRKRQIETTPEQVPESEKQPVQTQEDSHSNPGFFERLASYGVKASEGVRYGIDNTRNYFAKANAENPNTSSTESITETEPETNTETEPETNTETEPETKTENVEDKLVERDDASSYWVVRIPISETKSSVPLGKYEKEECKLAQMFKERKIDGEKNVNKEYKEVSEGEYVGIVSSLSSSKEKEKEKGLLLLKGTYLEKMNKCMFTK